MRWKERYIIIKNKWFLNNLLKDSKTDRLCVERYQNYCSYLESIIFRKFFVGEGFFEIGEAENIIGRNVIILT